MIEIDEKKCIGCGKCTDICPGNLIFLKNFRAKIRDVRDCWGCCACVKICSRNAICYRLAADLGGAGAKLFAEDSAEKLTAKKFSSKSIKNNPINFKKYFKCGEKIIFVKRFCRDNYLSTF